MRSKVYLSEILYLIFFLLLFITRILGLVEGNVIYALTLLIGVICFGMSYLMHLDTFFTRICDMALLVLAGVAYILSGEKGLLLFFIMMIGARIVSLDRLFKCNLFFAGIAYACMIFLCLFGFVQENQIIQLTTPFGDIYRRSISMLQVNVIMIPYLVFMMMILFLYRNENKRRTFIISVLLFGGLFYLFCYSFAKTALIVGILFLVLNYYYLFECRFGSISRIFAHAYYIICTLIGVICPISYKGEIFGTKGNVQFQSWFHRLYIGHYYWMNNTISLFGKRLNDPDPKSVIYPVIHQSQLYLLMQYGLVLFIVVNLLYHIAIEDMIRRKAGTEIAIVLSYATIGVVEPLLFNLSFKNISFLFLGLSYIRLVKVLENKKSVKTLIIAPFKKFDVAFYYNPNFWPNVKDEVILSRKDMKSWRIVLFGMLLISAILAMVFFNVAIPIENNDNTIAFVGFEYIRYIISAVIWSLVLSEVACAFFIGIKSVIKSKDNFLEY